jgi:hypothetical protein
VNSRELGSTTLHTMNEFWTEARAIIKLLLSHGADVNAMDFRGMTPLHAFCCSFLFPRAPGQVEGKILLVLDAGALLGALNSGYITPLCKAMMTGFEEANTNSSAERSRSNPFNDVRVS